MTQSCKITILAAILLFLDGRRSLLTTEAFESSSTQLIEKKHSGPQGPQGPAGPTGPPGPGFSYPTVAGPLTIQFTSVVGDLNELGEWEFVVIDPAQAAVVTKTFDITSSTALQTITITNPKAGIYTVVLFNKSVIGGVLQNQFIDPSLGITMLDAPLAFQCAFTNDPLTSTQLIPIKQPALGKSHHFHFTLFDVWSVGGPSPS